MNSVPQLQAGERVVPQYPIVQVPSLAPIFWVTFLVGFFVYPLGFLGFIQADNAANRAHYFGLPRERYWLMWLLTWLVVVPTAWGVFWLFFWFMGFFMVAMVS